MWAYLCNSASGMSGFPIWVQLIPQIMFAVQVGQDKGNQITKQHLRNFYKVFSGKEGADLDALAENGYNTMTANGDYILDLANYELLFANFLLGKTIYGPGKYIFGCFDNSDLQRKYEIIHEVE
ncbi:uncharacterized protein LOC111697917 [Eurytemora carolleeae]|uniref:uncharacterized protein LOC111697917 n=1 Tax=Eurytemora carolleeae TaxID=1294199 RepID=UPI000C756B49|nr:uncharacterized protein LOC111697917 [Eurytemora carolleeae]|eukprot:XP_023323834.1 uncharacterized protein LOC111697917 [Eurytemora affinis]